MSNNNNDNNEQSDKKIEHFHTLKNYWLKRPFCPTQTYQYTCSSIKWAVLKSNKIALQKGRGLNSLEVSPGEREVNV